MNSARVMFVLRSLIVATLMRALKIGAGRGLLSLLLFSEGYVYLFLIKRGLRMAARMSKGYLPLSLNLTSRSL